MYVLLFFGLCVSFKFIRFFVIFVFLLQNLRLIDFYLWQYGHAMFCLYHHDCLHNHKSHIHSFLFFRITTIAKSNLATYTILYTIILLLILQTNTIISLFCSIYIIDCFSFFNILLLCLKVVFLCYF